MDFRAAGPADSSVRFSLGDQAAPHGRHVISASQSRADLARVRSWELVRRRNCGRALSNTDRYAPSCGSGSHIDSGDFGCVSFAALETPGGLRCTLTALEGTAFAARASARRLSLSQSFVYLTDTPANGPTLTAHTRAVVGPSRFTPVPSCERAPPSTTGVARHARRLVAVAPDAREHDFVDAS
jgi:hypothetical protein